jgi:hypothetical protein
MPKKIVRLVHLVDFIYKEICYDARSHERKSLSKHYLKIHFLHRGKHCIPI